MPIKTVIKDIKIKTPRVNWGNVKYPCIGIAKEGNAQRVVLFTEYGTGTVIAETSFSKKNSWGIGHTSTGDWFMDYFVIAPKNKQFILSNN